MRFASRNIAIFALIFVLGCGDDEGQEPNANANDSRFNTQENNDQSNAQPNEQEPITREFQDEGRLCVGVDDPFGISQEAIEPGETIEIHVNFTDCLSSSCSANLEDECFIQQTGSGIYLVFSWGSYDDLSPIETECTADCMSVSTSCGEITVEADSFSLLHGDHQFHIEAGSERRCLELDDADEPHALQRSYENEGSVCLGLDHPHGLPVDALEGDEPFPMIVGFESCLSSSCSQDLEANCEVEIDGDDIFLSSTGSYGDRTHLEGGMCTEDCRSLYADCGNLILEEGSYTVHHGDETVELTIPSDDPRCH